MLDLTLGPSFKVKQWFTGFGELSFRWIQICIGLRCVGLVTLVMWLLHLLSIDISDVAAFDGHQSRYKTSNLFHISPFPN